MTIELRHTNYGGDEIRKFRLTYEGGKKFKDEYLEKFSKRENAQDFDTRKAITYVPAFAKAALVDIKNAIFSRMPEIQRLNGGDTYNSIMRGDLGGVDNASSSMNAFIGSEVLPEMMAMKRVGVYVDMSQGNAVSKHDDARHPYCYIYRREDILSWNIVRGELHSIFLHSHEDEIDEDTGLIKGKKDEYRLLRLRARECGTRYVEVTFYDNEDREVEGAKTVLDIPMIPFVFFEIAESLFVDVADYQIALLNLASSDVNYGVLSNFPFYTEQNNPYTSEHIRLADESSDGSSTEAGRGKSREVQVGATIGRKYGKGMDRPGFIHPSPEPLEVSMKKQEEMKREIRQLVNLAVSNMSAERESAESKKIDQSGLDSGLSYLGTRLEKGERQIAAIWMAYMGSKVQVEIKYPEEYSSKTVAQRLEEAGRIMEQVKPSPSKTFQKEMMKVSAHIVLDNRVPEKTLKAIMKEIDDADVVYVDPDALNLDVEAGLVTTEKASLVRGYPAGEAEKAEAQKVRRAAMIVAAQTDAGAQPITDGAARGVPELEANEDLSSKEEKERSQDRSMDIDNKDKTRGKGK